MRRPDSLIFFWAVLGLLFLTSLGLYTFAALQPVPELPPATAPAASPASR